jgi:cullin 3
MKSLITKDRLGETIQQSTMKKITLMLQDLHTTGPNVYTLYTTDFENMFIESSTEYYRLKSNQLLETGDIPYYLEKVNNLFIYLIR